MMQRLTRLVDVKSIVTIALTAVFAYLSTNQFLTVFTVIIAFYFGTQSQKAASGAGTGSGSRGE